MAFFNKVAIIGTGLIGGSMALAMKKKGIARQVIGVSRHKSSLAQARRNRVIDKGSQDLSIIKGADLVVLATPVNTILKLSPVITKFINKNTIVTDVGSTKKEIVSRLNRIFPNYIGSHPLAGSEKRGVKNAQGDIFKNSICILTPAKNTSMKALRKIKIMWGRLGAKVLLLSPDIHDETLSFVSHLPHAVAFSLIGAIPDKHLKFGATGLKDTTRIALSDSTLWADIFLSNRKNMLKAIKSFQDNLSRISSALNKKDKEALTKILKRAQEKREVLG
ncbi:MAG: prephenate dehydrogenase/arogenate dehydrogenase family protein [Candidatus Omnitrophica bacterium]|nr:prephenate dehydrogenase/arogenate dehydrogenase family protein [Candidatus Omnitrophota bacterium]